MTSMAEAAKELENISRDYVHIYQYIKTDDQLQRLSELARREAKAKPRARSLARRLRQALIGAKNDFVRRRRATPSDSLDIYITPGIERCIKQFETDVAAIVADYKVLCNDVDVKRKVQQHDTNVVGALGVVGVGLGGGLLILNSIAAVTCIVLGPIGLALAIGGTAIAAGVAISAGIAAIADNVDYRRLKVATNSSQRRLRQLCEAHSDVLAQVVTENDNREATRNADIVNWHEEQTKAAIEAHKAELRRRGIELKDYECPISLTTLEEPYATPNGRLYSRAALERWVAKNKSDPLTKMPLKMSDCKPATAPQIARVRYDEQAVTQRDAAQLQLAALKEPDNEELQNEAQQARQQAHEEGVQLFDSMIEALRKPAEVPLSRKQAMEAAQAIEKSLADITDDCRLGRLYRNVGINDRWQFGDLIRGGIYRRGLKRHAEELRKIAQVEENQKQVLCGAGGELA